LKVLVFFYVKSIETCRAKDLPQRRPGIETYGNDMQHGNRNLMEKPFLIYELDRVRKAA